MDRDCGVRGDLSARVVSVLPAEGPHREQTEGMTVMKQLILYKQSIEVVKTDLNRHSFPSDSWGKTISSQ